MDKHSPKHVWICKRLANTVHLFYDKRWRLNFTSLYKWIYLTRLHNDLDSHELFSFIFRSKHETQTEKMLHKVSDALQNEYAVFSQSPESVQFYTPKYPLPYSYRCSTMSCFNVKIDDQQSGDREMQTTPEETKMINTATQTENVLHKVSMRYIGTNVDTGEMEYEMIC